jgi:hypothetical protein
MHVIFEVGMSICSHMDRGSEKNVIRMLDELFMKCAALLLLRKICEAFSDGHKCALSDELMMSMAMNCNLIAIYSNMYNV